MCFPLQTNRQFNVQTYTPVFFIQVLPTQTESLLSTHTACRIVNFIQGGQNWAHLCCCVTSSKPSRTNKILNGKLHDKNQQENQEKDGGSCSEAKFTSNTTQAHPYLITPQYFLLCYVSLLPSVFATRISASNTFSYQRG